MTIANREAAIKECLKWEGGYSNLAADPGGATNWGITIADAKRYWKKDATPADVKAMPQSVAIDIYRTKYWKTPYYDCDKLEAGVDLAVFDFGVNSGPSRAKRYLDASTGGTPEQTINKLCDKRLAFLKSLSTWPTFGNGWGRRVVGIRRTALQMSADALKMTPGTGAASGIAAAIAAWFTVPSHMFLTIAACIGVAFLAWELLVYVNNKKVTNNAK